MGFTPYNIEAGRHKGTMKKRQIRKTYRKVD